MESIKIKGMHMSILSDFFIADAGTTPQYDGGLDFDQFDKCLTSGQGFP